MMMMGAPYPMTFEAAIAMRRAQPARTAALEQTLADLQATNAREEPRSRAGVVMTATRTLSPEELRVMRGMGHSTREWLAEADDERELREKLGHTEEQWRKLDQEDDEEADDHNLKLLEALERSPL